MPKPAAPAISHRDITLITEKRRPFSDNGWIFEIKHDGFRCLAWHVGADVKMITRAGNDIAGRFPELVAEIAKLPDMVFDGELVMLDEQGRSDFNRLRRRAVMRAAISINAAARAEPAAIFAFDLLWLAGRDWRAQPLLKRKAALKKALAKGKRIRYLDHVGEQGERLFAAADGIGLEGIVAKRADSAYRAGRSSDWVKIKTAHGRHVDAERAKWNE